MIMVSWNFRGIGKSLKYDAIKDILKIDPSYILMLQETKIDEEYLLVLSRTKWKKNVGKVVSTRGSSSGIATLCSEEDFSFRNSFATQHSIFTELHHLQSKLTFFSFQAICPCLLLREKRLFEHSYRLYGYLHPMNIGCQSSDGSVREKRGKQWTRPHAPFGRIFDSTLGYCGYKTQNRKLHMVK